MATPLGVEKYGRIDFALGRWVPTDPKTTKSMKVHARGPGELARTFFRPLSRPQESLFRRSSSICCKMHQTEIFGFLKKLFHICQHQHFPFPSLTTAGLHSIFRQCQEESGAKKTYFDQNYNGVLFFLSLFFIFWFQWTILLEFLSTLAV